MKNAEPPSIVEQSAGLSYFALYAFIVLFSIPALLGLFMLFSNVSVAIKVGLLPLAALFVFVPALLLKKKNESKQP